MADNTRLSVGAGGDLIRTEDIGGSYKIAVSKIYIGAHGVDGGPVAPDNPLPVTVAGTVNVAGAVSVPGTVTVQGNVGVSNTVAVSGTVAVGNTVAVSGSVSIANSVAVTGAVSVANSVAVTGSVSVANTVTVAGSVSVANTVAVSGNVNVANTVSVTGAVGVSGTVNVGNTVTVAGSVSVANTVGVSGTVNVGNTVTVAGSVSVANTVGVSGTVNVGNTVTVAGSVAVPGTVTVQGNVNALAVTGAISDGANSLTPKRAFVAVTTSGSNILVAGVAGKRIRVLHFLLVAASPVTVEVRSGGSTSLTGPMSLGTCGGVGAALSPIGHFETGVGADLTLQLSGTANVGGFLTYVEV